MEDILIDEEEKTDKDKDKNKSIRKKIVFSIIAILLVFGVAISVAISEPGCEFFQGYVDESLAPVLQQAMQIEGIDFSLSDIFYPDESNVYLKLSIEKFSDSHIPCLQWKIAHTHLFMDRAKPAYLAFKKYREHFSAIDPARTVEACYWKILCAKDAYQFRSLGKLIRRFVDTYEDQAEDPMVKVWYTKVNDIRESMSLIPANPAMVDW